jgi:dTDP-4-dehydrorhamnose 3,5-epimerase
MQQVSGGTGVVFTPKLLIKNSLGNLRHVAKSELKENLPFSEIYFSEVKSKTIKAWKFHSQQTQNITVAFGEIRVICVRKSSHEIIFELFELNSEALHGVLTIPHGIYYALINVSEEPTILLNVTDLSHDYAENLSLPLEYPEFITLINEFGN